MEEAVVRPPEEERAPEALPAAPASARQHRFGPSFAWGVATGSLIVILIAGIVIVSVAYITTPRLADLRSGLSSGVVSPNLAVPSWSGQSNHVVVSPTTAGKPWFSVAPNGTGTLKAWENGSSGDGGGPAGTVADFQVGVIDSVDGVTIQHVVDVYATPSTEFLVGGVAYKKGNAASPAEALFNDDGSGPMDDILGNAELTITFHRDGQYIIADRVSEPLEGAANPLQQ
jgi:hypothetical protein